MSEGKLTREEERRRAELKREGEGLVREGDKLLANATRRGWFSKTFGMSDSDQKLEDASDKYKEAVPRFREGKHYREAGEAYEKAAYVQHMRGDKAFEATFNKDAFKQYSEQFGFTLKNSGVKDSKTVEDAKRTLQKAAEHWDNIGELSRAGQARKDLAEWLENAVKDYEGAEEEYEKAAELYGRDGKLALRVKFWAKQVEMMMLNGEFLAAATEYGNMVPIVKGDQALKYSTKNYIFTKWLCRLANKDIVEVMKFEKELSEEVEKNKNDMGMLFPSKDQVSFIRQICTARLAKSEGDITQWKEAKKESSMTLDRHQLVALQAAESALGQADEGVSSGPTHEGEDEGVSEFA